MNDSKKAILLRWEKWRIEYNLILLIEGLWVLREHLAVAFTRHWDHMFLLVIAANVCYCLGPLIEICVWTLLGLRADRTRYQSFLVALRYFLFSVGLVFSMLLVWDVGLTALVGYLGGSAYYIYKNEFKDKILDFISFLALGFSMYLALIILFRLIIKARGKQT
jgi:hypothetical protein